MEYVELFERKLREKGIDEIRANHALAIVKEFITYLKEQEVSIVNIGMAEIFQFVDKLILEGRNTENNFHHLILFGIFTQNNAITRWFREILDGGEVMENLYLRLSNEYSENIREKVFEGVKIPPLGTNPIKKTEYTKKLITKLVETIGEEKAQQFLAKGLRDPYTEWRKPDRELFLKLNNIDDFLEEKKRMFLKTIESHRDENTLFFTQPVDDSVVQYVKENIEVVESGKREGNILYVTKIPHQTIEFLQEQKENMKAYYYCHCPWVKEAIKNGTAEQIPDVFCNCSGGYYKSYWEIVLEKGVKVDVLQSVKKGDKVCQFAIHLPENIL